MSELLSALATALSIAGIVFLVCGVLLVWVLIWERVRTNPDRIRETTQKVYDGEIGYTFVDQVAYFRIFGREWGPFPIVSVNARYVEGPSFVRCLDGNCNRSHLVFRLTSYEPWH
jgi:hypothetical protein